jgi:hypothetical protein
LLVVEGAWSQSGGVRARAEWPGGHAADAFAAPIDFMARNWMVLLPARRQASPVSWLINGERNHISSDFDALLLVRHLL